MTDKEKQAIEKLHNGKKMDLVSIIRTFKREGIENFVVTKKETIETVLNLIEKQSKELETLKDFKEIAENKVTDLNPIGLARVNQLLSRQCHNLQEEIEKKDKIIDLMAEYIASLDTDEEICKNIDCDDNTNIDTGEIDCANCIKEYFKKKVEVKDE